MFIRRAITAIILIPLVLLILFKAPAWLFKTITLFMLMLAAGEWSRLIPIKRVTKRMFFIILILLSAVYYRQLSWLLLSLPVLWPIIAIIIMRYPRLESLWGRPWVMILMSTVLLNTLVQALMGLMYEVDKGRSLILYILAIVWAADIGAYLFGKWFGRHKLIPEVSPGKSWEGVFGGMVSSMFVVYVGRLLLNPSDSSGWIVISLVCMIFSIFGDLLFSMFKRRVGIKDTGHIFPGHGGLLDRIDSMMSALPLFYLGITLLKIKV